MTASLTDLNEDWIRTRSWDRWNDDGSPVTDLSQLIPGYGYPPMLADLQYLRSLMSLPSWQAAPATLQHEVAELLDPVSIGSASKSVTDAQWPGWERDQQLASIYAPQIAAAFSDGMASARSFLAQLITGEVRVTPTYAAQEVRNRIAAALRPVLTPLWTDGYTLGAISARHVLANLPAAPASTASASAILTKVGPKGYIHGWIKVDPDAIAAWQHGEVSYDDIAHGISDHDAKIPDHARSIAESLRHPETSGKPVYRGMAWTWDNQDKAKAFMSQMTPGNTFTIPASSFSEDRESAKEFASADSSVLLEVDPGSKGIDMSKTPFTRDGVQVTNEQEWIAGGKYRVNGVTTGRGGRLVVQATQLNDLSSVGTTKSAMITKVGPKGYIHGWKRVAGWSPAKDDNDAINWAKNSAVPQEMYHGTASSDKATSITDHGFDESYIGENSGNRGWAGEGIYLTERPDYAATYGIAADDGKVLSTRVNVKNPWDSSMANRADDDVWSFQNQYRAAHPSTSQDELSTAIRDEAEKRGHDSIIQRGKDGKINEMVAFSPQQVTITGSRSAMNVALGKSVIKPVIKLNTGTNPYPEYATGPDWGEWEPGDVESALKIGTGPRLQQLLHQWGVNTIQSVSSTKLDDLAKYIGIALATGQDANSLASDISSLLNVPSRAQMIAQTEISRASSAASLDQYLAAGVSMKSWLVAPDERVCKICRAAEAEGSIPLSQAFLNGVDAPPGHPNCRCAASPMSVGDFDLSDMTVEPLPGFNLVPLGQPNLVKVGAKGYIHGWIFVGIPGEGDEIKHDSLGHGIITSHDEKHVTAQFDDGSTHTFNRVTPQPAGVKHWSMAKVPQLREYLKRNISDQDRADIQAALDKKTPKVVPAPDIKLRSDLAVLKPARSGKFNMNQRYQALDELEKTPDGKALVKILDTFQNTGGKQVARIRTDVEKSVNGGDITPGRKKTVNLLLSAIRDSDVSEQHLYRGMMIPGDAAERYKTGSPIDISLGSFSSNADVGRSFSHVSGGQHVTAKNTTPVLLDWVDGPKKALPLERLAGNPAYFNEREYLATGNFEVTGTRIAGDGTLVVNVRQVKPL